jgi:antitoxin (DNA-binding transcriptional repressor) of toxin-antitoxin stability system
MDLNITIDGAELLHNGSGYGTVTSTGNLAIDLVALKSNLAETRATTLGTSLNVRAEGNPLMPSVTFLAAVTSATGGNGENYTNTEVAAIGAGTNKTFVTSYDVFTLTIDGKSASASVTLIAGATSATGAVAARDIVLALDAAWTPYGTGASSTQSLWDTTSATAVLSTALKSSNSGSRGFGKAVSIAWTKATADQVSTATAGLATSTIMDWTIGATEATTDNTAAASALVLTLTEVTNSVAKGDQVTATLRGANGIIELATTQYTKTNGSGAYLVTGVATTTATDIHETDARGDVVNREAANEGTTTAGTARFITNRSGWTFSVGS